MTKQTKVEVNNDDVTFVLEILRFKNRSVGQHGLQNIVLSMGDSKIIWYNLEIVKG